MERLLLAKVVEMALYLIMPMGGYSLRTRCADLSGSLDTRPGRTVTAIIALYAIFDLSKLHNLTKYAIIIITQQSMAANQDAGIGMSV